MCPLDPEPLPSQQLAGYWMWGLVFLAVAIFEAWAVWTKHRTLSQTVHHGPTWLRWAFGVGFAALIAHLCF